MNILLQNQVDTATIFALTRGWRYAVQDRIQKKKELDKAQDDFQGKSLV